ncbi:YceI family protein [Indioceanicola profundi]|uniref:YceI family protein n=1 Tax=Indioceanicola profundi TaxID=2220096 RepID=UPI001CECD8FA|nr:YceI family protein [Indioceanicola profundi]
MEPGLHRTVLMLALGIGLALSGGPAAAEPRTYRIDPDHASFAFRISHMGLAHVTGFFREVEGSFTFDEEAMTISDVKVEVATDSVDTGHKERDAHLRKKDFLWSEEHPTMSFVSTGTERTEERTGRITGDLTLRGVTRPVTFTLTYNGSRRYPFGDKHHAVGAEARGAIRRSEFGMTYGLEGNLVGDEVEIVIGLEGIQQE